MKSTKIISISALFLTSAAYASLDCSHLSILSHRGLSGLLAEETKVSYLASADLKTDYLEMDVHRTKDHVLILNHDDTFARTTNIKKIFPNRANDPIYTFTYAEVSKLRNTNAHILRLEDAITISLTHENHPGLYMETKSPHLYPGIEKEIVDLLQAKGAFKKVKIFFQSFDIESIKKFKALRPETPRLYLTEEPYEKLMNQEIPLAAQFANGIGPNFNDVKGARLQDFLSKVHSSKLVAHFWTIDNPNQMKEAILAKTDGLFTNRTDLLVEICGKMSSADIQKILSQYIPH